MIIVVQDKSEIFVQLAAYELADKFQEDVLILRTSVDGTPVPYVVLQSQASEFEMTNGEPIQFRVR